MIYYLLSCVYFFGPAYLANAAPPLVAKLKILNSLGRPVDNNKTLNNKPILGDHKTWRGVISEIIICTTLMPVLVWLHGFLGLDHYSTIGLGPISQEKAILIGFLMSIGIVFGDLFFAFIKRRLDLKPGTKFAPFDQINYVIGAFIFIQPFLKLELKFWFWLIVLTFFIHVLFNRAGYNMGLHNAKW